MAALCSFGANMDTHGQALTNQQETLARHDSATTRRGTSEPDLLSPQSPPQDPLPSPAQFFPQPPTALPAPQRYDGSPGECCGFITRCQLTSELQPTTFPSDRSKIAYIITLSVDKAQAWATAIWQRQGPECSNYKRFTEDMLRFFDWSAPDPDAAKTLTSIRHGRSSVADYTITFRTLAAESGWNEMLYSLPSTMACQTH